MNCAKWGRKVLGLTTIPLPIGQDAEKKWNYVNTSSAMDTIGKTIPKTLYNMIVNSPQNVKSLSVLSPGIGSWN